VLFCFTANENKQKLIVVRPKAMSPVTVKNTYNTPHFQKSWDLKFSEVKIFGSNILAHLEFDGNNKAGTGATKGWKSWK